MHAAGAQQVRKYLGVTSGMKNMAISLHKPTKFNIVIYLSIKAKDITPNFKRLARAVIEINDA
jgi:hypothetical protein